MLIMHIHHSLNREYNVHPWFLEFRMKKTCLEQWIHKVTCFFNYYGVPRSANRAVSPQVLTLRTNKRRTNLLYKYYELPFLQIYWLIIWRQIQKYQLHVYREDHLKPQEFTLWFSNARVDELVWPRNLTL